AERRELAHRAAPQRTKRTVGCSSTTEDVSQGSLWVAVQEAKARGFERAGTHALPAQHELVSLFAPQHGGEGPTGNAKQRGAPEHTRQNLHELGVARRGRRHAVDGAAQRAVEDG